MVPYVWIKKVCLNLVKKKMSACTHEQKMNYDGFTQNDCYLHNQPQPFELGFYRVSTNTSCYFTKQDLTVN